MNLETSGFHAFLELMPQGILILKDDGEILLHNERALGLLGSDDLELMQNGISALSGMPELKKAWDSFHAADQAKLSLAFGAGRKELSVNLSCIRINPLDELVVVIQITDVSEIKKMENLKNGFTDRVIHGIKGPLTSINTSLALLTSPDYVDIPSEAREIVALGYAEVRRLGQVLDEAGDWLALETGMAAGSLYFENIPLRNLVESSLGELRSGMKTGGLNWRWEIGETDGLEIIADYAKMRQILPRIAGNLIDFHQSVPNLVLSARQLGKDAMELRIAVETEDNSGLKNPSATSRSSNALGGETWYTQAPVGNPYPVEAYLELMGGSLSIVSGTVNGPAAVLRLRGGFPEY